MIAALFGDLVELMSWINYENEKNRAARITNSQLDSSAASLIQEQGWPTIGNFFIVKHRL